LLSSIQHIAAEHELFADVLGETVADRVKIAVDSQPMISAAIAELGDAYEGALERALRTELDATAPD
jgi:hypothetical protein